MGTGIHEFEAEIIYDTDQPSLKLKKSIIIYDNAVDAEPEPEVEVVEKPVNVVEPKPTLPERSDPVDVQKLLSELAFDDIFFDYGVWKSPSISFNTNYIMSLGKIVKAMKTDPAVNLQLTGHTDRQGSDAYNNDLAIKRASAVARLICDMFKESEREQIAQRIVLRSAGKSEMLFSADNRMKEALNRRVSIQLCTNPETGISYSEYLKQLPKTAVAVKKPAPKVIAKPVKKKAVTVEEQIYQKAYQLFNESNYNDAAGLFKEIISLDPKHALADNAQWWLAEIEYSKKNYQEALLSYSKVFELGDGNKSAYAG